MYILRAILARFREGASDMLSATRPDHHWVDPTEPVGCHACPESTVDLDVYDIGQQGRGPDICATRTWMATLHADGMSPPLIDHTDVDAMDQQFDPDGKMADAMAEMVQAYVETKSSVGSECMHDDTGHQTIHDDADGRPLVLAGATVHHDDATHPGSSARMEVLDPKMA